MNGTALPTALMSAGGVNASTQSPSGMPAQMACQTEPSRVAPKAIVVPIRRTTPLVPNVSIKKKPVRKVPRMLPTIPHA